jgi:hydrophobe/amphiphile efflux-3 (HAE3) family protein
MQRFWSNLAVQLGKRAGVVSLVGLLITVALGLGIPRLKFATGQDSYLNKADPIAKTNLRYQTLFGGQAVLGVISMQPGHDVSELFDANGRQQFTTLHDTLASSGRFTAVVTPLLALQYSDTLVQGTAAGGDPTAGVAGRALLTAIARQPKGSPEAAALTTTALATEAEITGVQGAQRLLSNPAWDKILLYDSTGSTRLSLRTFFPDRSHALVLVRLLGNLSIQAEGSDATLARDSINRMSFPNATISVASASLLLKDINDYLRGGMLLLGGIAVAIMVLILLVLFDVRWRLLPLGVILVGVVWAFGVAGYLGIPLTIVTIAGLPVMLGVGIDYAIQMHARIEEEAVLGRADHPVQATARGLCPALLVVTFDAVFAFAALHFAKVPMIRDFGLLLAVGIVVICIGSIMLPLAILGIREFKKPTQRQDFHPGSLGKLVVRLGSLPQNIVVPLIVASVVVFLGGAAVEGRLTLQTDPIQWVNQSSAAARNVHAVEHEIGAANELGLFVTANNVFSAQSVSFLHSLTRQQLAAYGPDGNRVRGQFTNAASIESIVAGLIAAPGAGDVAPTAADVKAAYQAAPPELQRLLVSPDGTAANIVFQVAPGSLARLDRTVKQIRTDARPPAGISATPSGLAVIGTGLLENLEANRILLTYLAMALVFAFLAVRLRSLVRSLLSLVPVAIAVGTASLVEFALHLSLSPMTAVGGPLVIAACTEFTSLILLRFVEERNRGLDPQEAMDVAASRTGRAFIVSALTAIAGVAVLSLSSLPLLRDFGRIVAMNVTVALLSALVVLPPILVWAEGYGWVTRGLLKPEEPFVPTPRPGSTNPAASAPLPS